jgi:hypothetical protein
MFRRVTVRGNRQRCCAQCNGTPDGKERWHGIGNRAVLLHDQCVRFYRAEQSKVRTPAISAGPNDDLAIPLFLRRGEAS